MNRAEYLESFKMELVPLSPRDGWARHDKGWTTVTTNLKTYYFHPLELNPSIPLDSENPLKDFKPHWKRVEQARRVLSLSVGGPNA